MTNNEVNKDRLTAYGEYFTPPNIVEDMLEMVSAQLERIDSRFLEPACGTGNFLVPVLDKKLQLAYRQYRKIPFEYEQQSLLALGSIYGIELQIDNVIVCRDRLFSIWEKAYKKVCRQQYSEDTIKSAKFIINRNIVCGNALTMKDEQDRPLVLSEWAFIMPRKLQRTDYLFANLSNTETTRTEEASEFLKKYVMDYRRIWDNVD